MMRKMSALAVGLRVGSLFVLLPLGGCFTYADAPLEAASPGTQTRLRLDEDGFGRLVNQAAMNGFPIARLDMNRRGLIGRIMDVGPDNLSVQMRGIGGSMFTADIRTSAIEGVAVRSFSKRRTIGAIAAGFALGATLGTGLIGGTTLGEDPEEPEYMVGIPYLSVPFVSIPFP